MTDLRVVEIRAPYVFLLLHIRLIFPNRHISDKEFIIVVKPRFKLNADPFGNILPPKNLVAIGSDSELNFVKYSERIFTFVFLLVDD